MDDFFTSEEKKELFSLYRHLLQSAGDTIFWRDCQKLKKHLIKAAQCNGLQRNNFGMNPVIRDLQTAVIVAEEIGMKGSCLIGIMLHEIVKAHILSIEDVNIEYGEDVGSIIKGLVKTNELYSKSPAIESENFRNLLLSFAEDMRVILVEAANTHQTMQCAALFMSVNQTDFSHTHRQVSVGVHILLINQHTAGAVHGFYGIILTVDDCCIHVIFVVIPVAGGLPQASV